MRGSTSSISHGALSFRVNHEEKLNNDNEISDQDKFTEDELNYLKNLPLSISLVDRDLVLSLWYLAFTPSLVTRLA